MSSIFVAVEHKENRRLLMEYLGQHYFALAHTETDFNTPFDLGIFDGRALDRMWRQVYLRKEAAQPLFLPILLVTPRQDINLITRQLWQVLDEIILTPIEKPELFVRIEVLLRARRMSLEVESKNIQLQQEFIAHREADQALQESEERFSVALKNSPIIVAHIDRELRYTWVHNAHHAFGTQDVVGKRDDELLPPDTVTDLMEIKRGVLATGVGSRREVTFQVDQPQKVFDVTIEPVFGNNELLMGMTMAAEDITARKMAEERIREIAALEERQRLARELHDAANQTVFTMNMMTQSLLRLWDQSPEQIPDRLEQLAKLGQGAMSEMRTLLLELRPTNIVKTSLRDLFNHLVDAAQGRKQIKFSAAIEFDQTLPEDIHIALYRIAQESINNIVKHSKATEAHLSLYRDAERVVLRVSDNGQGFETETLTAGLGLSIMRERAGSIGASLDVISAEGQGTQVIVTWIPSTQPRL